MMTCEISPKPIVTHATVQPSFAFGLSGILFTSKGRLSIVLKIVVTPYWQEWKSLTALEIRKRKAQNIGMDRPVLLLAYTVGSTQKDMQHF